MEVRRKKKNCLLRTHIVLLATTVSILLLAPRILQAVSDLEYPEMEADGTGGAQDEATETIDPELPADEENGAVETDSEYSQDGQAVIDPELPQDGAEEAPEAAESEAAESEAVEPEAADEEADETAKQDEDDMTDAQAAGRFRYNTVLAEAPGSEANPYLIEAAEDLAELAGYVNGQIRDENDSLYADLAYRLTSDLDLSSYPQWIPIGIYTDATIDLRTDLTVPARDSYRKPFRGTFDGAGHTITGLRTGTTYNSTYGYTRGLFGLIDGAVITNLNIIGAAINGRGSTGILAGYSLGETVVSECFVAGTIQTSGDFAGTGGLIGYMTIEGDRITPSIRSCRTDAAIRSTLGTGRTGGLIGYVRCGNESFTNTNRASFNSTLVIEDCEISGSVNAAYYHLGGLIGDITFWYSDGCAVMADNCVMYATVTGENAYHTGGLVGYMYSYYADNNTVVLEHCDVETAVIKTTAAGGYHVGGIAGYIYSYYSNGMEYRIEECRISANEMIQEASGAYDLGGMIGNYHVEQAERNSMLIQTCQVSGNVVKSASAASGTTSGTGGLIGTVKYTLLNRNNSSNGTGFHKLRIEDTDVKTKEICANSDNIGGLIGLYYNYKSDDSELIIQSAGVYADSVYGYAAAANRQYNRRVGGAIGWYRIEGEAVAVGTIANDPAYYRTDRTYFEMQDCTVKAEVYTEGSEGYETGGVIGHAYAYYAPYAEIYLNRCVAEGDVHTAGAGSYRVGGIIGIANFQASSYSRFELNECDTYGDVRTEGPRHIRLAGCWGSCCTVAQPVRKAIHCMQWYSVRRLSETATLLPMRSAPEATGHIMSAV